MQLKLFPVAMAVGLASAVGNSKRQEDSNDVDVGDACREHNNLFTGMCAVIVTYTLQTDPFAALIGEFNMQEGDNLIHMFEDSCDNHVASRNFETLSPGFEAHFDDVLDVGDIAFGTTCFNVACTSGNFIGPVDIIGATWGDEWLHGMSCTDEQTWIDGIELYAYKYCSFACHNHDN